MITLVVGCMKAGKSKYVIDEYLKLTELGLTVDIFQPSVNTRDEGEIRSRAYPDLHIPCKLVSDPSDILKSKADYIIIDEFQMFNPEFLKATIMELKKQKRNVIVAGLNYMANGKEFSAYTAIKNIWHRKIKLTTKCQFCDQAATRTMLERLEGATDWIENEFNVYTPVCKDHFVPFK